MVLIYVEVIPHKCQRYPTCGDWQFIDGDGLHVHVSDTGNRGSNFLVALHEVVEAFACRFAGVSEASVDEFDMRNLDLEEPGESKLAPYHKQHVAAEIVERIAAHACGINWQEHCARVEALFETE